MDFDTYILEVRDRAKSYAKRAKQDTLLTIGAIIVCVLVFVSSDLIAESIDDLNKSDFEQLSEEVAADVIRIVRDKFLPNLGEEDQIDAPIVEPSFLGDDNSLLEDPQRLLRDPVVLFDPLPDYDDAIPDQLYIAKIDAIKAFEISKLENQHRSEIELERVENEHFLNTDNFSLKWQIAENDYNLGLEKIKAELDAEVEQSRQKEALFQTVISMTTKIGSLLLLIWLVRIFNSSRQRNENASQFYTALGDAAILSKDDTNLSLIDALRSLLPPDARTVVSSSAPAEDVIAIASKILKSNS